MKKNFFFMILLTALVLVSCNTSPEFIGEWELESLKLQDEAISAADLGNPIYTFNENNTYNIAVTGLTQSGTWSLEGDNLRLVDNENPESDNVLNIIESTPYKFHYTAGEGNSMTHVVLKRKE